MRLIDADAWVDELKKKYQKTKPGKKGMRDLASDMVLNMIEKIENRPTAYDVDKVVEELDEAYNNGTLGDYHRVVKGGGQG